MDAFPRCFAGGLRVIKFQILKNDEVQHQFLNRYYKLLLVIVSLGGFFLFYFSAVSMIKILEGATILAFLTSPVIAFLNLRAVQQKDFPESHRPSKRMIYLAYSGLFGLVVFSIYYLINL